MRAYSLDLRERVAQACDAGCLRRGQVASLFRVSTAWIRRLLQRRRDTGSLAPRPHGGGRPPGLSDAQLRRLAALVAEAADATLEELRQRLGAAVSVSTVQRALGRLGLTVKKSRWPPTSATAPTSARGARRGVGGRRPSRRRASCSSTKPGPTPP